jgi:tetratricopeptide (TPR) repeat protein
MFQKSKAVIVAVTALLSASMLFAVDSANEKRLQQGIDMLDSKGDLASALPLFEQAAKSSDHKLAARALLYVGQIQERQGRENAKATYEDVLARFGNQSDIADEARKHLTAMGALPSDRFSLHSLTNVQDDSGSLSADGRVMAIIDWDSNGDIALQDTSTGKITPISSGRSDLPTSDDEYGEWAAVSPDQSKVLYFWDPNQKNLDYQLRLTSTSNQIANQSSSQMSLRMTNGALHGCGSMATASPR